MYVYLCVSLKVRTFAPLFEQHIGVSASYATVVV